MEHHTKIIFQFCWEKKVYYRFLNDYAGGQLFLIASRAKGISIYDVIQEGEEGYNKNEDLGRSSRHERFGKEKNGRRKEIKHLKIEKASFMDDPKGNNRSSICSFIVQSCTFAVVQKSNDFHRRVWWSYLVSCYAFFE